MKLFRLYFFLGCCFLMNTFQATAQQCSITNLTVTSTNCVPNALDATNTDITYCGSFTAANTSGDYEFAAYHQAFIPTAELVFGLAKDGVVNFCVTITGVSFLPEGLNVNESANALNCGATSPGGNPTPCTARPACALTGQSISNVCCDGNGGLRIVGSFMAANGSGNYRVQVDGVPDPFGFPGPSQFIDIPASPINGVINFDVVLPNFDYTNIGSGIYVSDNFLSCSTTAGQMPPASAAACASCNVVTATAPIPTMSQWGLMIFGLLILNLSVVFLNRKQSILKF